MTNIDTLAKDMKGRLEALHQIPMDDLVEFFDALGAHWLSDTLLQKRVPYVRPLAEFIRKVQTIPMLRMALRGDYTIMDRFIGGLHAQPRGLVVHWLAGNAALLGCYSLFQALITKNVSIVKPSSRAHDEFEILLDSIRSVNTSALSGEMLRSCVSVVIADRTDHATHEALSRNADVRIAWGGEEAVTAITGLPKSVYSEDIVFGPKYSFGVVDADSMKNYKTLVQKIALDVCTFDQFACSSPHTIFVEEGSGVSADAFAESLGNALEFVGKKFIQKGLVGTKKQMDILTLRAKYAMTGRVIASKDTEWTVIVTNELGHAPACGSRVVFVKTVGHLEDVIPFVSRRNQTLGMAVALERQAAFLDLLTLHGVDRCVPFGTMTFFDSPWDGMFIVDRLVRWVSVKNS